VATLLCLCLFGTAFHLDMLYLLYRIPQLCSTLAVPTFKLKTEGDRSFCASEPRALNSLPPSLRDGAVACTDGIPGSTPGSASVLLRYFLLGTHFDGLSSDSSFLLQLLVVKSTSKRVNCHRSSVPAREHFPPVNFAPSLLLRIFAVWSIMHFIS